MTTTNSQIRDRVAEAICAALEPLPEVLAGWEGGSAAFGTTDAYSDVDLNFLVTKDVPLDLLYMHAERFLTNVSPIVVSHSAPPGRYYKLKDVGEFLLVDLCFFRVDDPEQNLEVERHGQPLPLFDKGAWLRPRLVDEHALALKRQRRYEELLSWFPVSQSFVRKAILRGKRAEALGAFWAYTLRPLAEILRMRYCPMRWDFGVRYIDRDLPEEHYAHFTELTYVLDLQDLEHKLEHASAWGSSLLSELRAERAV